MAEKRARGGVMRRRVTFTQYRQRCGLIHYLWAHGYRLQRKRGLVFVVRVENPSAASRAEGAIYLKLSEELEAQAERDAR